VAAEVVNDEAAAMHLLALNRSVAWKANKRLGAINLAWFVLGFLIDWQTLGGPCKLHWLILLHFGLFALRCMATIAWFVRSFRGGAEGGAGGRPAAEAPAGLLAISSIFRRTKARAIVRGLPRRTYGSKDDDTRFPQSSCVVCLDDFFDGESLPQLACGHALHAACLEQWLSHRRICPICQAVCTGPAKEAEDVDPRTGARRRRHHELVN